MRFPLRNLSNVRFDPKEGQFKIGRKTKERTVCKYCKDICAIVQNDCTCESPDRN